MLDVHPPHHAANSWRDFFIHIATIVVGLLIAIGLEQVVEHVHQHFELRETREALEKEQLSNESVWAENEHSWRWTFAELKNDLLVLEYIRTHPGVAQKDLPGVLSWIQNPFAWNHAVWDAAQQNGVVRMMKVEEANGYLEYYSEMAGMSRQSLAVWDALNDAHAFDLRDPDPTHLSAAQLEEVERLTAIALTRHIEYGYSFGLFADTFPKRPHTITWELLGSLRAAGYQSSRPELAAARAKTLARLKAANGGPDKATILPEALK
jgi:hypothetical protein